MGRLSCARSVLAIAVLLLPTMVRADETHFTAEQFEFFESKVRPLLVTHCYECHSAQSKNVMGGLWLDSRQRALAGGESGAAVVAGKPDESLLVEAVRFESFEMPPKGKLADQEIEVFVRWIEMGAPWPQAEPSAPVVSQEKSFDWPALRSAHWAWQPIEKPAPPAVQNAAWVQNDIDRFILAQLEQQGLTPAPPAAKQTLVRRVFFDLVGLPPTPEEVETFVRDERPEAFAQLVDRLLESPHYGEKWGRHWLDVARYSDGYGGFQDSEPLPNAWRYRDWVVSAFNRDMPYNEFLKQQIAGDLLDMPDSDLATGLFALGPTYISDGGDPQSVAESHAQTLDDRVDTLSRGLLGVTVSCARCHDHKFDPIPQQDYYSLAGIFNNTRTVEKPLAPPEVVTRYETHQAAIREQKSKIDRWWAREREAAERELGHEVPDLVQVLPEEKLQYLNAMRAELTRLRETAPERYPYAHVLADAGSEEMNLAIRGNLLRPGSVAPRRFLRIVAGEDPPRFVRGSGRLELAEAVTEPSNPLTARVMANRVWLHLFGKGLVRTPSNFGILGEPPTHPELLDWLASTFIESDWSVKQLHRAILLSATYQMSSQFDAPAYSVDADNRLLWRMNLRRLPVESLRDALLAVTGELDRTPGGAPVKAILESRRRTLYTRISRNGDHFESDEFLRLFDFPQPRATSDQRTTSIVPQQFLFLLNSSFMAERAQALAERLKSEAVTDAARIERVYQLLYARTPSDAEKQLGLGYLRQAVAGEERVSPWQRYAQVLLSANEFMFVQ